MKAWVVGVVLALSAALLYVATKEVPVEPVSPVMLTNAEQMLLLAHARDALNAHLAGNPVPELPEEQLSSGLLTEAACFVTLNQEGHLRGCILDSFVPHESIAQNVARNVVLAATADARFPPVSPAEVPGLQIEISILGKPYPVAFTSPEDFAASLRPGVDGVILTTTHGSSTFLPQVWEQLPDPETFLGELCLKHGAPADCWRTNDLVRVELYQVHHFGESDPLESDLRQD